MDIKHIKDFATKYTVAQLMDFADELENNGHSSCPDAPPNSDPAGLMSDFLQAAEVRGVMDAQGISLNEAVREFSKRVRGVLG